MLFLVPRSALLRPRGLILACLSALLFSVPLVANAYRHAPQRKRASLHTIVPSEEWTGLYFGQKKVGYSVTRTSPIIYHSRPALQENGHTVTRLLLMGAKVEEDEASEAIMDLGHRPLKQTLDIKSNGSALHIEALFDYAARKVYCTLGSGTGVTHKTLVIPAGANLTTDPTTLTEGRELVVGRRLKFYYLQPLSVELRPAFLDVNGKTMVRSDSGKQVAALEVQADLPEGKMVGWARPDGSLIKSEIRFGAFTMTMVQETKAHALETAYISPAIAPVSGDTTPALDFADATAVAPDRLLPSPRKLRFLKVAITGVPEQNLMPSDSRQSWTRVPGLGQGEGVTADYSVRAERFSAVDASKWPVRAALFAPYLGKAAYLETDDSSIRETAAKLRGNETNLYVIAASIRDWVHSSMTPDASIGVVRSAKDVYDRRRGVCRDYATLYTALARAAGIPTRLCAGIVYSDGKFFYHAWAESFVGRWVAFDPTLYDPKQANFVDATHIKFAQGDVTQMLDVVSIVGRLKIRVLDSDPTS